MKRAVRIISLLLIISLLPFTLISCDRRYDEAEVKAAAEKLLLASAVLNEIYYGEGIPYLENSEHNVSLYCEADPSALNDLGFKSIAELKRKTLEVFTEAHAETMFKGSFSGTFSQSGASNMARYYQKFDDNRIDPKPICIMVRSNYESMLEGEVAYKLDTLQVTHSEGDFVHATVVATVSLGDKT
jgi:hypothetical protein